MWIEKYLFYPSFFEWIISFIMLPFTFLYCLIVYFKFPKNYKNMGIKIISIGNLIVGGSGKTPIAIFLANRYKKTCVVMRGYGRKSKGCKVVSRWGNILLDVEMSGDEAQEIAQNTQASVIVAENREEGIIQAKKLGAKIVILDDGFDKGFEKLNLVIDVKIKNKFCLPSGGYRYPRNFLKYADLVLDESNFKRVVDIPKVNDFVLISAISKPQRLLKFVNTNKYHFFMDHHSYNKEEIEAILEKYNTKTILTTYKDYVKLKKFGFDIKIINLNIKLNDEVLIKIDNYVKGQE